MNEEHSNPYSKPSEEPSSSEAALHYQAVPILRRNGFCSMIILAHVVVMFLGGWIPYVGLLGLVTTIGVIVVCVAVLSGPIYYDKLSPDGDLQQWSGGNKVAAVILLIVFVGWYGFIAYHLIAAA